MATVEQLKAMVQRKLQERGLSALWPAIDYIVTRETAGTWDSAIQSGVINKWGTRENSWGLFQLFIEGPEGTGLGYGHTPQELQNPERNTDIALDAIQGALAEGKSINEALRPWSVTHGIDASSLVTGQVTALQGGGNMVNQQETTNPQQAQIDALFAEAQRLLATGDPDDRLDAIDMINAASSLANAFGISTGPSWAQQQSAAQGWAGLGQSAESQALAQRQFEFTSQQALEQANRDEKTLGLAVAAQNFANTINQATEARARAQFAVDYSRAQAPAGMTESPYTGKGSVYEQYVTEHGGTPRQPLPMVQANIPSDPWALLQQAGTTIPPAAEVQATAPQLPVTQPDVTQTPITTASNTGYVTPTPTPIPTPVPTAAPTAQGPLMTNLMGMTSVLGGTPVSTSKETLIEAMRRLGLLGG